MLHLWTKDFQIPILDDLLWLTRVEPKRIVLHRHGIFVATHIHTIYQIPTFVHIEVNVSFKLFICLLIPPKSISLAEERFLVCNIVKLEGVGVEHHLADWGIGQLGEKFHFLVL
jgi:hypothetical protein